MRAVADCGCKPGTRENGWMEERSEACQKAEFASWCKMLDRLAGKEKNE